MAKKRFKIKDKQGNPVDYDISSASVTIDVEGKSLDVKLSELVAAIASAVKRVTYNGAPTTPDQQGNININQVQPNWTESNSQQPSFIQGKPNSVVNEISYDPQSRKVKQRRNGVVEDVFTLPDGGSTIVPDAAMSDTSENAVQNKVVKAAIDRIQAAIDTLTGTGDTTAAINTMNEVATFLAGVTNNETLAGKLNELRTLINGKVDSETGKGLSTEDYTTAEKSKLGALPTKAELDASLAEAGKVKTVSVNGGTPAQPDAQGNVNIEVGGGSSIEPATSMPQMDGTATAGTSAKYAREDHVHPHDSSKQDTLTFDDVPTTGSNKPVKSGGVKQAIDEKANIADVYSKSAADAEFATKTELNNVSVATVPSNQVAVITNLNGADEENSPNAVLHADEGRKLKEVLLYYLVPILRKAAYSVADVNNDIDNFINSLNLQSETGNIIRVAYINLSLGYIDNQGLVQQSDDNYFYDKQKKAIAFALLDSSANAATVSSSRIAEYDANGEFLGSDYVNKPQIEASHNPTKIKAGFAATTLPAYIAYFVSAAPLLTIANTTLDNSGVAQSWSDSTTRYASDYIDISYNKGFLLWMLQTWEDSSVCCFYDLNHTFISRHVNISGDTDLVIDNYKKVTIPSSAAYVRFAGNPGADKTFLYAL